MISLRSIYTRLCYLANAGTLSTATRVLSDLFETFWGKETIPSDWVKGFIIKLPKKVTTGEECPKTDTTRKKDARTTKDNLALAEDSNGGATTYGALMGRDSGCTKGQDPVEEYCCSIMPHWV